MKELAEIIDRYVKDLIELGQKLEKYENGELDEDPLDEFWDTVLDVKRVQNLQDGGWATSYYELCLAWGGPGIWVRTDYVIEGAWGGEHIERVIDDPDARYALDVIHERLEEIYGK